jgi:ABC-type glycerol-3-phosphate transport system substrate-binding protein
VGGRHERRSAAVVLSTESADEQRNQFVQRQEAKSSECDVFYSDVIWTAEFAIQNWLYDMTPYVEQRRDEFIPSTFETATYDGKVWGVPHKTNAGFLYYRTDQVDAVPKTWQEVYEKAAQTDGIAYPQISQAIYKNVNEALSGKTSPEDALKQAQTEMEQALKTF